MGDTNRPSGHSRQLAEFLRARRDQVKPERVGIPHVDRRRVPGLRREELAMLAGLSTDYVMRLEQGRDHRPSARVLDALARALQLDEDATTHLFQLGGAERQSPRLGLTPEEVVRPALQELLDSWTTTPAFIHGRRLDVLASNALARALTPLAQPGNNLLRSWFLDLEDRQRYEDIRYVLTLAVAYFRAKVGNHLDDPGVADLVDELSRKSTEFREVWARHDVNSTLVGDSPIYHHPSIGSVQLRVETFAVDGTDRQTLYVVGAAPGSRDARALEQLASLVAEGAIR